MRWRIEEKKIKCSSELQTLLDTLEALYRDRRVMLFGKCGSIAS
jgi:hypothetical protein